MGRAFMVMIMAGMITKWTRPHSPIFIFPMRTHRSHTALLFESEQ
jgi:hypothetical protein